MNDVSRIETVPLESCAVHVDADLRVLDAVRNAAVLIAEPDQELSRCASYFNDLCSFESAEVLWEDHIPQQKVAVVRHPLEYGRTKDALQCLFDRAPRVPSRFQRVASVSGVNEVPMRFLTQPGHVASPRLFSGSVLEPVEVAISGFPGQTNIATPAASRPSSWIAEHGRRQNRSGESLPAS